MRRRSIGSRAAAKRRVAPASCSQSTPTERLGRTGRSLTAYRCRVKTVENTRRRCVLEGFELALCGRQRSHPPVPKLLNGEQESQVIALRLGSPPPGCGSWSLRLLARQVVELGIVDSISHETVRQTLKKTVLRAASCSIG